MRKRYTIATIVTTALLLSACGGDGKGKFDTGSTKITVANCETYTTVKTNDLLVKDDSNTTIKIVHDINGTKQVCVSVGSAHIIREAN